MTFLKDVVCQFSETVNMHANSPQLTLLVSALFT